MHSAFGSAQTVEDAFYDALARADLAAMMALWADDDDVVCVHPGGQRLVGLEAIRQAWAAIFENGGVDARTVDLRVHQTATCEVHHLLEQVTVRNANQTQVIEVSVVNVYVKSARGWHLLIHHASTPIQSERSEAQASPRATSARAPGLLH
jgi:uncharacterized protein (TIGR02246 family)